MPDFIDPAIGVPVAIALFILLLLFLFRDFIKEYREERWRQKHEDMYAYMLHDLEETQKIYDQEEDK